MSRPPPSGARHSHRAGSTAGAPQATSTAGSGRQQEGGTRLVEVCAEEDDCGGEAHQRRQAQDHLVEHSLAGKARGEEGKGAQVSSLLCTLGAILWHVRMVLR